MSNEELKEYEKEPEINIHALSDRANKNAASLAKELASTGISERAIRLSNEWQEDLELSKELSNEKILQLNNMIKSICENEMPKLEAKFKENNPDVDFNPALERYVMLEKIFNDPAFIALFPKLTNIVKPLSDINSANEPCSINEQNKRISSIAETLSKNNLYLNIDFLSSKWDFLMGIKWKTPPSKETLAELFGENSKDAKAATVIYDKEFDKKGYAMNGITYLNAGATEYQISESVKNGRFTEEQVKGLDTENINLATVNHEEAHRLLWEVYHFPKQQPIPPWDSAIWSIDGIDFVPNSYTQIDEFIAHSIGQNTDSFETIANIADGISDFKQNPDTWKISYTIWDRNNPYWLLRSFVMEEVAKIMEEKWVPDFKEKLEEKTSSYMKTPVEFSKESSNLLAEYEKYSAAGDETRAEAYKQAYNSHMDPDNIVKLNAETTKGWNKTTQDVISVIWNDWLHRIAQKCMEQSKKYMLVIEQKFKNAS